MTYRRLIVAALIALAVAALLALRVRPAPVPAPAPAPAANTSPTADQPTLPRAEPRPDRTNPAPPEALPPSVDDPVLEGWGTLVVDVVDEQGLAIDASLVAAECTSFRRLMFAGSTMPVPVGACAVRAFRRDGVFTTFSEDTTIEVGHHDPAYVLLELPRARKGGVGLRFQPEDDGMRVMEVVPGSAAADAGLEAGDLVLDVAGHPTAGMETATFVELMTGAEGTDVTFTVGWSGDTGLVEETLTVARRFLDG